MKKITLSKKTKIKLFIIGIIIILFGSIIWRYKDYILYAKDKILYIKTDKEHSFEPNCDKYDLIEKSTTPDDSVCIVSDMTKLQKKDWKEYNDYSFENDTDFQNVNLAFFNHMQRISSNKFVQISYTYKKPFIFAKPNGYKKKDWNEVLDFGDNFGSKMMSLKLNVYDISQKKYLLSKELINNDLVEQRNVFDFGYSKSIRIFKDKQKKALFIEIPFYGYCFSSDTFCRTIDKNGINTNLRSMSYIYKNFTTDEHKNWMDIKSLGNLLKQNGVDLKGVICLYNNVDYNDVNLMIRTENLPQKDAYLYKVYPKLKKYIGKKGKWARFYLKDLKNSDEIVSYFLPENQKVSYGDGIEIELDDRKKAKVKSLEEYFILRNKKSEKQIFQYYIERLSGDVLDFK